MKIRSNEEVIKSWIDGKPAEGRNLRTDGNGLYSFGLKIGFTVKEDDIESDTVNYPGLKAGACISECNVRVN